MLVIGEVYTILVIVVVGKVEGRTMLVSLCLDIQQWWAIVFGYTTMVGHCVWIYNKSVVVHNIGHCGLDNCRNGEWANVELPW